jgi:hypothetical protein
MDVRKMFSRGMGLIDLGIICDKFRDSLDVRRDVEAFMPFPDTHMSPRVKMQADHLCDLNKQKYMILGPEFSLIEEMAKNSRAKEIEIIVTLPVSLEDEDRERICNNIPHGVHVEVLSETFFPKSFFPKNGVIVVPGYMSASRAMVMSETYRMVEHYSGFWGKRIFVPYRVLDEACRYPGWWQIDQFGVSDRWEVIG